MSTIAAPVPANFAEAQDVLAAALPGYTRRPHQMAAAEIAEQAIVDEAIALLQAGTGTGKSLALLIPAIIAHATRGLRTVVATSTKALQNQYKGDLTFLQEHLGVEFTWATLKGRGNYPCHAKAEDVTAPTASQQIILDRMTELSTRGEDGKLPTTLCDREDFPTAADEDWKVFSMSANECPGAKSCPFADKCFAERAKAKAADAAVVVTNTAYLMQDLKLRKASGGNVALLGEVDLVVVDEAHKLEEAATGALEDNMGEGAFAKLARDVAAYLDASDSDPQAGLDIEQAAKTLWAVLSRAYAAFLAQNKGKADPLPLPLSVIIADQLGEAFINLYGAVQEARTAVKDTHVFEEHEKIAKARMLRRLLGMCGRIESYTTDSEDITVRWLEQEVSSWKGQRRERLYLRSAPISVAPFLKSALWDEVPVIMASATLTTASARNGDADFSYLIQQLGLQGRDPVTFDAGSPFDYPRQAMTFVPPKSAPEPTRRTETAWRGYAQAVSLDLIRASRGGAFLLYTSRSAMNAAYQVLEPQLTQMGLLVLRQGDYSTPEMIRLFKENGNAVLFGLKSFFEGVDVSGRALRLVVLDKLPFGVPTDVLNKARVDALDRRFGEWGGFSRLTIPAMTLILIQAYGRLIRHMDDQGVVAILDNRLRTKRYGAKIMSALPDAPETDSAQKAFAFLAGC